MADLLVQIPLALTATGLASAAWTWWRARHITRTHPPTGDTVTINGDTVHYAYHKAPDPNAETLVFLHGASANLNDARTQMAPLLGDRYNLVFLDRPGHGWSARGGRHAASPVHQAGIVTGLLDALTIDRAFMIGHSWGASLATTIALDHPDRVSGLVLLAPATHPWPGGVLWYYKLAARPYIGWLFTRTIVTPIAEFWMPFALRCVFAPGREPADYIDRTQTRMVLRPRQFRANAQDIADLNAHAEDYSPRFPEINVPTAVVTGTSDTVVSPTIHAEALHRDIGPSNLVVLDAAGHMPHYTHSDAVVAAIDETVARARSMKAAAE